MEDPERSRGGPRKWWKSRIPRQQGGYICFRTLSYRTGGADFYTIPLDFDNNGGGEPEGLRPFYRSGISRASTFVAVGSSSLFCIGGMVEPASAKATSMIHRFDTYYPNRGWYANDFEMLSPRKDHTSIVMDGKVLVIGDLACSDDTWAEFFDPFSKSSLPLPQHPPSPLPRGSSQFVTVALTSSERILVASRISDDAYVYHPLTGEWEEWDQLANFFPIDGEGEAAVVRNTTLCWFHKTAHTLHAYDLDLKMWFKCPIGGLDKVGLQLPDEYLSYSLLSLGCDCLCLVWLDHACYANTSLPILHCTKVRVSMKVDARGTNLFEAFVVSS